MARERGRRRGAPIGPAPPELLKPRRPQEGRREDKGTMPTGRHDHTPPRSAVFASAFCLSRLLIAVVLLIAAAGCRASDRFPDGPILLVCPWAAGGGTDRIARQIAAL